MRLKPPIVVHSIDFLGTIINSFVSFFKQKGLLGTFNRRKTTQVPFESSRNYFSFLKSNPYLYEQIYMHCIGNELFYKL
jgi:hypothetical protein